MVAFLEALAQRIGPTVDNTYEALLVMFGHAQAGIHACELSQYAQWVFKVFCNYGPF